MTTSERTSVAVLVPVYREHLEPDEELSLRHLDAHLGRYDRCFVAPESLRIRRHGFDVARFPDACFRSVDTYSRLLLSADFYRAFARYRYILIYQLDCLVLSDRLAEFCAAGYDYLGAPWLVDPTRPELGFSRVGNGGFSLRRTAACLDVLHRPPLGRLARWRQLATTELPDLDRWQWRQRLRVLREASRGVDWYASRYSLNEDHFWSDRATLFDPSFRVAPVDLALRFSFERAPHRSLAETSGRLPFGCHAWNRWDRRFWEPHLLR